MGFGNRAAATSAANNAPKKSRWAGVASAAPRPPMLPKGQYEVELVRMVTTFNPGSGNESCISTFKVTAVDPFGPQDTPTDPSLAGTTQVLVYIINGKSTEIGQGRVKAQCVAFAGYDSDDAYDAADPEGLLIGASFNNTAGSLCGRRAYVAVAKGSLTDDGDYFRECEWLASPNNEPKQVRPA